MNFKRRNCVLVVLGCLAICIGCMRGTDAAQDCGVGFGIVLFMIVAARLAIRLPQKRDPL